MGVKFQPTHEGSPWEKGTVERAFASIASLFAQYVAGYLGRSVDRRGKNAEKDAVWSMVGLQDLLDEWIVLGFTDRGSLHPRSDLRQLITYMSVTCERGGRDHVSELRALAFGQGRYCPEMNCSSSSAPSRNANRSTSLRSASRS